MRTCLSCIIVLAITLGGMFDAAAETDHAIGTSNDRPDFLLGVCQLIESADKPPSAFNVVSPAASAWLYLRKVEKLSNLVTEATLVNAKTFLLKSAAHGTLKFSGENAGEAFYQYYPDAGYAGTDQATFLVEMGNYKVRLIYHFKVGGEFGANDAYDSYKDKKNCPNGRYWKVS